MKSRGWCFLIAVFLAAFGLATFHVAAATHYVWLDSPNPTPPYSTWETAAHVIQDAVDVAETGSTVLVTNGVYSTGARDIWGINPEVPGSSRVVITDAIRLLSVNGPQVTTIEGGDWFQATRCVYLGSNAVLSGFTLTKGNHLGGGVCSAPSGVVTNCILVDNIGSRSGGGAFGGTLYDCTIDSNFAFAMAEPTDGGGATCSTLYNCTLTGNSASWGGGASYCTLFNCMVMGNSAPYYNPPYVDGGGGGAHESTLFNCTVTGNSGGGASDSTLFNCTVTGNDGGGVHSNWWGVGSTLFNSIVYYNFGGNYNEGTVLNFSCTTPLPTNGVGNITGPPLFMDMAAGDSRLREDSPCIDAGTNLLSVAGYACDPTDILGNTRFIDGNGDGIVAWDMGAYEFNSWKAPRFSVQPQLTAEGWKLNLTGASNKWARLQRSSDLVAWEDVWWGWMWMGDEGMGQCNDGDMGQKAMFYRAVVP